MIWQKRLITVALILTFNSLNCGFPPEYEAPPKEIVKLTEKQKILMAFIAVESAGNVFAYNKSEQAAGILQIRPIMLKEINRLFDTDFVLQDRFDSIKSVQMFWLFQSHHNPELELEQLAKSWNGNANWKSLKYTAKYYAKIEHVYSIIE